jgi:hypothetical protein
LVLINHFKLYEDVCGLVMRTSSERQCITDGKTNKEIVLHLFDNRLVLCNVLKFQTFYLLIWVNSNCIYIECFISGNCECVLTGAYVDEYQNLVDRGGGGLPIILIQLAKIRSDEG